MKRLLVVLAALFCVSAAADPAERLTDAADEARARALMSEIRCVVCQNESIADSGAPLAADMRRLVRRQVEEGRSDAAIKTYLVRRYGDFVLLRPRLTSETIVLWAAPVIAIVAGLLLCVYMLRNRRIVPDDPLEEDEVERLRQLREPS